MSSYLEDNSYLEIDRKAFRKNTVVIGEAYTPPVEGKPDQQQYQAITEDLMGRIMALKTKELKA